MLRIQLLETIVDSFQVNNHHVWYFQTLDVPMGFFYNWSNIFHHSPPLALNCDLHVLHYSYLCEKLWFYTPYIMGGFKHDSCFTLGMCNLKPKIQILVLFLNFSCVCSIWLSVKGASLCFNHLVWVFPEQAVWAIKYQKNCGRVGHWAWRGEVRLEFSNSDELTCLLVTIIKTHHKGSVLSL